MLLPNQINQTTTQRPTHYGFTFLLSCALFALCCSSKAKPTSDGFILLFLRVAAVTSGEFVGEFLFLAGFERENEFYFGRIHLLVFRVGDQ